jgi:alpha-beta hydrolase superfamily lysophospholipase
MEKRRARARLNDDVLTHFRSGACGPAEAIGFLPAVACPTLILAGEHDPVVPAAATRRFAALFTNATTTLEILPGIGHGAFRQATQQAFTHGRNFIAHANVSRDGSLRPGSVNANGGSALICRRPRMPIDRWSPHSVAVR